MIRWVASLAAAIAIAAGSNAFTQTADGTNAGNADNSVEAGAAPGSQQAPGLEPKASPAVDASAITCADFVTSSSKDRSSVVATLSDQVRRTQQPASVKANPMPGSRFAPVPSGQVLSTCKAHPELRVAEVVESEVATSR